MGGYQIDRWIPGEYGDPGMEIEASLTRVGEPHCVAFQCDDRLWYPGMISMIGKSWAAFSEMLDGDLYGCLDAGRA